MRDPGPFEVFQREAVLDYRFPIYAARVKQRKRALHGKRVHVGAADSELAAEHVVGFDPDLGLRRGHSDPHHCPPGLAASTAAFIVSTRPTHSSTTSASTPATASGSAGSAPNFQTRAHLSGLGSLTTTFYATPQPKARRTGSRSDRRRERGRFRPAAVARGSRRGAHRRVARSAPPPPAATSRAPYKPVRLGLSHARRVPRFGGTSNIYRKLHIFDRTQAVIYAISEGVIAVEEREYRPPGEPSP